MTKRTKTVKTSVNIRHHVRAREVASDLASRGAAGASAAAGGAAAGQAGQRDATMRITAISLRRRPDRWSACEEHLRQGIGLRELERLDKYLKRGAEKGLTKRNSRIYYEALELRDLLAQESAEGRVEVTAEDKRV